MRPLDEALASYWHPEAMEQWRRRFESCPDAELLRQVLRHLPPELGSLDSLEDLPGEPFVVLVTYDEESESARWNAACLFAALAETRAITFFGTEGSPVEIDVRWMRVFPDKDVLRSVADQQLREFNIAPLEHAAIVCREPIVLWGIEDKALYEEAREAFRGGGIPPALTRRRLDALFTNLLTEVQKRGVRLAGASVTAYNCAAGHRWLLERRIAHACIRASSAGKSTRYNYAAGLRDQIVDPFQELLKETFRAEEAPSGAEARAADREKSLALRPDQRLRGLEATCRRRFQELAVLPAETPFDWALAAAVWGDAEEEAEQTDSALETLYRHALLDRAPGGRYVLYRRLHALTGPVSAGAELPLTAGRERYQAYFVREAAQFQHLPPRGWTTLAADFPHLKHAGADLARDVTAILGDLEATAAPEVGPGPPAAAAEPLLTRASAFAAAVRCYVPHCPELEDVGLSWLQLGLASARALGQRRRTAVFLRALSGWQERHGQHELGQRYGEQARRITDEFAEELAEADVGPLAGVADGAAAAHPVVQGPEEEGQALGLQTLHLQARGELDEALTRLREQEAVYRRRGDKARLRACLLRQGAILAPEGLDDPERLRTLLREAEQLGGEGPTEAGSARVLAEQAASGEGLPGRQSESLPPAPEPSQAATGATPSPPSAAGRRVVRVGLVGLVMLAVLSTGVDLAWRWPWLWLLEIPVAAFCLIVFATLLLSLTGALVPVPCPRCGNQAVLWRRKLLVCQRCGRLAL